MTRTNIKIGVLFLLIPVCSPQTDSKWVWSDSRSRSDNTRVVTSEKKYNGELASLSKPLFQANANYNDRRLGSLKYRYEVTETPFKPDYTTYRPRPPEQYRPDPIGNGPYRPPPDFVRPTNSFENYRPTNRPYENEFRPIGNGYRPTNGDYSLHGLRPGIGTNGKPILTGPTPSWEEGGHQKYKDYDICKCVHSFNCNSPGIKFGSCDVDKQYCCYKSKRNEGYGNSGKPVTNIYERPRPRPVLAGPGGPVDFPGRPNPDKIPLGRPFRPDVDKYTDPDKEFNEAYKKGLASAIYELSQRPNPYNERNPQDYYQLNRDYYKQDNFKSTHPSKYGLYDPSVDIYGRSSNSTILSDLKI